jgi:hypothetical protein
MARTSSARFPHRRLASFMVVQPSQSAVKPDPVTRGVLRNALRPTLDAIAATRGAALDGDHSTDGAASPSLRA